LLWRGTRYAYPLWWTAAAALVHPVRFIDQLIEVNDRTTRCL
jgi:hypothetical protein